jgi:hypothetical protein
MSTRLRDLHARHVWLVDAGAADAENSAEK